jgi:5-methyltetrahydrofolate--homocysteine methyltransferase
MTWREVLGRPAVAGARRRPILVGERINAHGSRRARALLLAEDHDGLIALGREQLAAGAEILDLHVALPDDARADDVRASDSDEEKDGGEAARMSAVAARLAEAVAAPLMIDSSEPHVLIRALEQLGPRAIANSVSLVHGRSTLDAVVPVAKRRDAAVVALCIDEDGMAVTSERKLQVARRLYDISVHEHGLPAEALDIDPLTFALAVGDPRPASSAAQTIGSLREIKERLPAVSTLLGISDVSYGLPREARLVLNSVFLHHAAEAGLDLAIVHAGALRGYDEMRGDERQLAEDLLFDRRPDGLTRFTAAAAAYSVLAAGPTGTDTGGSANSTVGTLRNISARSGRMNEKR